MLMIILGLIILGIQSYSRMKLDSFPEVDFPFVTVTTVFPGASPEDVEELVVKPIEDAVATIAGIDEINSTSVEGVGNVTIAFVEGVDANQAAIDVERQVATVRGLLPAEAEDPTIIKIDINAIPILIMSLNGPQSQDQLFELADDEIKTRLQAVPGVASVSVTGGRSREVQVFVDPAKLAAFGLPLGDVQRKLSENNVTFPAGSIEEGRQKISVRSVGEFQSLEQIENLVIRESDGGAAGAPQGAGRVYLRDVATVQLGREDQDSILRYNGRDAVSISVVKSSDANTVETVDNLKEAIEELNEILPPEAEMIVILDNSEFIRESVAAVLEDLVLAILITGMVILVFLHNIRSTFIVVLAIPTCLISTFLVMWMLDFSFNQLTLLALTLVIGILVDDSIVVIENIERHLEMKKPPMQAALEGRSEIGFAAITITLVDVVVYLPVAFTSGIIGQFFFSYGVTVAVTTLFSLFVAFTLTPMLAGLWLEDPTKPETPPRGLRKLFHYLLLPINWIWKGFIYVFEKSFSLLANFYGLALRFFLWNFATQILAVLIAAGALALGIYLVIGGFVGSEFLPQSDDGQIRVTVEMPAGTNLAATDRATRQIENLIINNVPETSAILAQVGTGAGGDFGGGSRASNTATINLILVDKQDRDRSTTDVVEALRPLLQQIPEAEVAVSLNSSMGGGGGSPVQFRISGTDPNVLIDLANQVEEVMKTVPGTVDVQNNDAARSPETQLVINRDLALDLGIAPAQVANTLRTALSGSPAGKYEPESGTEIDIMLRMNEAARQDFNQLLQLPLAYVSGQPILLDRVVDTERSLAPARIIRADRQRVLTVGSGIGAGLTTGEVTDAAEAAIQEQVDFPPGYSIEVIGASESQREAFAQLGQSILLGIILIYMLMVALYQSWLQPLAIMFSLPVTLVGAIGGLYLTGNTLNIISLLGVILLIGVVTKNAILIVDFTNSLRENEGYGRKEALIQAGRLRLRAVLMTTLALVLALFPLLLGAGAGSEGRAPLAAVVIGGNISSTLLTLILVPVVYNFFDWGSGLLGRIGNAIMGTGPAEEESRREEETPEPEEEKEREKETPKESPKQQPKPSRPSPQPGSAITLNPPS
jgi:HAE1 family hydrophobic/amphiphilic exporter-1